MLLKSSSIMSGRQFPVGFDQWHFFGAFQGNRYAEKVHGGCCALGNFLSVGRRCFFLGLVGYSGGAWLLLFALT